MSTIRQTKAVSIRRWPHFLLMSCFPLGLIIPGDVAIIGPLGSFGNPVRVVGLILFILLLIQLFSGELGQRHLMTAFPTIIWTVTVVLSWIAAQTRVISADQGAKVDRTLLLAAFGVGIVGSAGGMLRTKVDVERAAWLLSIAAVICVAVAFAQFVGAMGNMSDALVTPLTHRVTDYNSVQTRAGFNRVAGTLVSPLEYSAILPALTPLFLHLSWFSENVRYRRWGLTAAVACVVGLPIAFSRTALLCLVVALAIYLPVVSNARRILATVGVLIFTALTFVLAPSIFSVFAHLVTGAATDESVTGRTSDYARAFAQFWRSPFFGIGLTSDPQLEFVLDNQWLGTAVASGLVGVFGLAVLYLAPSLRNLGHAHVASRGSGKRSLNMATCAGLITLAVAGFTFDTLAFPHMVTITFLLIAMSLGAAATPTLTSPEPNSVRT